MNNLQLSSCSTHFCWSIGNLWSCIGQLKVRLSLNGNELKNILLFFKGRIKDNWKKGTKRATERAGWRRRTWQSRKFCRWVLASPICFLLWCHENWQISRWLWTYPAPRAFWERRDLKSPSFWTASTEVWDQSISVSEKWSLCNPKHSKLCKQNASHFPIKENKTRMF